MASLVQKDTSGIYVAQADEVEVPELRTRSFKKFSLPDAEDGSERFRVAGQVGPIHYRLDPFNEAEPLQEIDLAVVLTPGESWDAACETNGYQVRFWQSRVVGGKTIRYIAQFRRAGKWLAMAPVALVWENAAGDRELISKPLAVGAPEIDHDAYRVTWQNAFGPGLHLRYNLSPDEFFKTLVIESISSVPVPSITGPGLKLTLAMANSWHSQAKAANGFAGGVDPTELAGDIPAGDADEESDDPDRFSFRDEAVRDVWWLRRPRAWDSTEPTDAEPMLAPLSGPVSWKLRRHGEYILSLFSIPATWLARPDVVYPVYVDADIAEQQTAATDDDALNYAAVYPGDGNYSHALGSGWLGANTTPNYYMIGARFAAVPIAAGSTIDDAWISWKSASVLDRSGTVPMRIAAEAADNPGAFAAATHEVYDAQQNPATTVDWTITNTWSVGVWYGGEGETDAVDIAATVQSVVDRGGWATGQAMLFTTWWVGAQPPLSILWRKVYHYDEAGNVSGPKFNITYTAGGGSPSPSASASPESPSPASPSASPASPSPASPSASASPASPSPASPSPASPSASASEEEGNEEANLEQMVVVILEGGWQQLSPNSPVIMLAQAIAGGEIQVVAAYDRTDEAGVAETVKMYVNDGAGGAMDWATPVGSVTLATGPDAQAVTVDSTGLAGATTYLVGVRAQTAAGEDDVNTNTGSVLTDAVPPAAPDLTTVIV